MKQIKFFNYLRTTKQFVVLEGIVKANKGQRFYTLNSKDEFKNEHSATGIKWYREIGFADNGDEARKIISKIY